MHDIDFDEIDRAINSAKTAQTATRATPVMDTPPVAPTPAVVSSDAPKETEASAVALSPAIRRSSGRFMDVVHPSSDMRPSMPARKTPAAVAAPKTVETLQAPAAEKPESTLDVTPETPLDTGFQWPDPIDLHEVAQKETNQEAAVAAPAEPEVQEEVIEETADEPEASVSSTPLESPFLTDAKVEKRPLGAFSFEPSVEPVAPVEELIVETPETPVTEEQVETVSEPLVVTQSEVTEVADDPEIPRELHNDLLKLDTHGENPALAQATPAPAVVEDVPTGPTSITQQYKEQPSSTDQTSGAIYDTATYHQALVHPPQKRSSILIIVWILAIIVVGGGLGYLAWLFVYPMLS